MKNNQLFLEVFLGIIEKTRVDIRAFSIWWELLVDFRNFCMCDEMDKMYRRLEEIICTMDGLKSFFLSNQVIPTNNPSKVYKYSGKRKTPQRDAEVLKIGIYF